MGAQDRRPDGSKGAQDNTLASQQVTACVSSHSDCNAQTVKCIKAQLEWQYMIQTWQGMLLQQVLGPVLQ